MASTEAPVWLLLRGLGRGAYHWGEFPDHLAGAFPGTCILTPDLPGNGERWRETSPVTIREMVDAYRQAVPIDQPLRIIALSLGGMVGLQWLLDYPEDIAQLVLINSSASNLVPFYQRLASGQLLKILWGGARGDMAREGAILRSTSSTRAVDKALQKDWADYARRHPVSLSNLLRQLKAAAGFHCPEQWPPTLAERVQVMGSAGDKLVSLRASRRLAEVLGRPLHTHDSAGHDLTLDDGDWLIAHLLR